MKRIGISIYPEHSTLAKDQAYIARAAEYGFQRLFMCLLSLPKDPQATLQRMKRTISYAKQYQMHVMVDVSPQVFEKLGIHPHNLSFFYELGVDGIRLDQGFTGYEAAMFTHNRYGLQVECNLSSGTNTIDEIISYQPNRQRLAASHNFYPHRYTGLADDHFVRCSQKFKQLGIPTAAFVNSQAATFGPWPITEGLCTLEMHREMPIAVQTKHLFATGLIDDVIIGNAYASEAELEAMSQINRDRLIFTVIPSKTITALERKVVFDELHVYRGDVSSYLIRSTASRIKYKTASFPPTHCPPIQRGDILIENNKYGQYKGELQIALQDMPNSGKTNVVGRIVPEEIFLVDYLKPWGSFGFVQS